VEEAASAASALGALHRLLSPPDGPVGSRAVPSSQHSAGAGGQDGNGRRADGTAAIMLLSEMTVSLSMASAVGA